MALRVISRRCDSLVAAGGIADIGSRWSPEDSVANDPTRTCRSWGGYTVFANVDRLAASIVNRSEP